MVMKYTKKDITKMFVFVIVKDGEKKKLHVRAKDIDTAFQNAEVGLLEINGEILEVFSFDEPVNSDLYGKIFGLRLSGFYPRNPILPAGIPGKTYQEWVPERYT